MKYRKGKEEMDEGYLKEEKKVQEQAEPQPKVQEQQLQNREALNAAQQDTAQKTGKLQRIGQVLLPKKSLEQTYSMDYNESIGAGKRRMNIKRLGSQLNAKRKAAETVEEERQNYQAAVNRNREAFFNEELTWVTSSRYQRTIAPYLSEEFCRNYQEAKEANENAQIDRNAEEHRIVDMIVEEFMNLDLSLDITSTKSFVSNMPRIEELIGKTHGVAYLLRQNKAYCAQMKQEDQEGYKSLMGKIKYAVNLTRYCNAYKAVLTDGYYQTHYNSEIGLHAREEDPIELKMLTRKLWRAEGLKRLLQNPDYSGFTFAEEYQKLNDREEWAYTNEIRGKFVGIGDMEASKNNYNIDDSQNADYFRDHYNVDDPVYKRVVAKYRITGDNDEASDGLSRSWAAIARWKPIQSMERGKLEELMGNLSKTPKNAEDPQEVEECRQANLKGVLQYKSLIKKQLDYLKRKYGTGLSYLTEEEYYSHMDDFQNDFTDMQAVDYFIEYLQRIGQFDEDGGGSNGEMSDREMLILQSYYSSIYRVRNTAGTFFAEYADPNVSYTGIKRAETLLETETYLVVNTSNEIANDAEVFEDAMSLQEHYDVRWDTMFEEGETKEVKTAF